MTWLKVRNWLFEYRIVVFMIFVFFGWIIIWAGYMLLLVVIGPR